MAKKLLIFLSLLCVMVLTSGCVKYKTVMEIDRYDNIKFFQTAMLDVELIKEKLKQPNFNIYDNENQKEYSKDLRGKGYFFEVYKDYPYEGLKVFKKMKIKKYVMDSLPKGFSLYPEEGIPISFIKTPFKTTYVVHIKFNASDISSSIPYNFQNHQLDMENESKTGTIGDMNYEYNVKSVLSPLEQAFEDKNTDMKFVLKIPVKALEHNADEVIDSKTYEWNLAKKGEVEIKLTYEKVNYLSYIYLFALLFGTFWFIFTHERYKPKREDDYIPSDDEHYIPHHESGDEIVKQNSEEE